MSKTGFILRFGFQIFRLTTVIEASNVSQAHAQVTNAPLHLFISGGGTVSPLTNGESLVVGQTYSMVATPAPGFAFSSWQPANVFTFTTVTLDAGGNPISTNISVVPSLLPIFTNQPSLDFVMQPEVLITSNASMTMTKGAGWQANFEPILLNIRSDGPAVILAWTNLGFTLQAAPAPLALFTNVSSAVSPYTNNGTAQAQYFRLISN